VKDRDHINMEKDPAVLFHRGVWSWFEQQFGAPTQVQAATWPLIAAGRHVLATAPTGSGKTLTAFLWSLNRFATGALDPGATRVLYVSPLKALNNDIQRNLLEPLAGLESLPGFPAVRALTRSGDTPQNERQRMLRRPPEILITTPESLFLLLTARGGRQALATVETVIVDEVHSLVDNRRGVALMTSLERLADLAGEFQRIALSATVRPLDEVAAYVGGVAPDRRPRPVEIVDTPGAKALELRVRFPEAAQCAQEQGQPVWDGLCDAFRAHAEANRSTLIFTNSRSLAEKITFKLNEGAPEPLAYAHHGSLSREIRTAVESRLKAGELKAIVATSSLEMGIDIGHLDEVVLVQSPGSVAATLQRIGRAGHRVGETSRGTLYPSHALDFLEAAVLTDAVAARDIEPLSLLRNPLDVLAQIIVSCCAQSECSVDAIFEVVSRASPYRTLSRSSFELVLEMLAGRYAGSRVRELKPRIHYDRIARTVKAHKSALFALYNSGGTIPDRGYYKLRHAESGAELGELDEEFVWEARLGQIFSFGTQNWQIRRITHNDVLVEQARPDALAPPFWRAEVINRGLHFSERLGGFLETADSLLASGRAETLRRSLVEDRHFDDGAADELVGFLTAQRDAVGCALPHRHHLVLEHVMSGPGGYRGPDEISHLVIHSFWGGCLNRPWALAIEGAWQQRFGEIPEIHADNNAISILLRAPVEAAELLGMVTSANLRELLRGALESSGFFGARFRECAGRALLLTRRRFDQRLPLWLSRLQAKKLMTSIAAYPDFPVLLETWRTCIDDEFDLPALAARLDALQDGVIRWSAVRSATPSPMASHLTFATVSRYMYADDSPDQRARSSLSDELIGDALTSEALRPRIRPETVEVFLAKRQRLATDYRPGEAEEWADWLKERVLIAEAETCDELVAAPGACWVARDGRRWLAHRESLPALVGSGLIRASDADAPVPEIADPRSALQLSLEIVSFYGPLTEDELRELLPAVDASLVEDDALVAGPLLESDQTLRYCERTNLEALLRLQRALARPSVEPRPQAELPAFLAAWQGFGRALDARTVEDTLERLKGYSAAPAVWLGDLFHARWPDFDDHRLDEAFTELDLVWWGTGRELVTFGHPEDMALLLEEPDGSELGALFSDPAARYTFGQLADRHAEGLERFNERFWDGVWHGEVYSDSLAALRGAVKGSFRLLTRPARQQTLRGARRRSTGRLSWPGNWMLRRGELPDPDPLTELEDSKERARMLLDRYGFVCRELANREGGRLRWARLARALFAMELAGEVVAGYFFSGLSGPQFMSPAGLQTFQSRRQPESFWLNALDPASPCGLGSTDGALPPRRARNYLAFHGGLLKLTVENGGRRLRFLVAPDDDALPELCEVMRHLTRTRGRVTVEEINGTPALDSPYAPALERILNASRDHRALCVEPG
jgi:ATP-dependent Lhr-like helicase